MPNIEGKKEEDRQDSKLINKDEEKEANKRNSKPANKDEGKIKIVDKSSNNSGVDKDKSINEKYRNKKIDRIAGSDRFETSVELSKKTYDKADTVILVNGYKSSDALTAVPFAHSLEAPILLSDENRISDAVRGEINRLGAKKILVIGGESVVSRSLVNELSKSYDVHRIAGRDRYETSTMVASEYAKKKGRYNRAIMVNGDNLVDALSISNLPEKDMAPVLLTESKNLNANSKRFIDENKVKDILILGGSNSVSRDLENHLRPGRSINRIYGKDRYHTSMILAGISSDKKNVIVASGKNYADALTLGSYAIKNHSAVIMVDDDKSIDYVKEHIEKNDIGKIRVVGGRNSIPESLKIRLESFIRSLKK